MPATIPFLTGFLLGLALGAVLWRRPIVPSVRSDDDFAPVAWVIRSGHGWLEDPATLRMIANASNWTSLALVAHRYRCPEDALPDLERLRAVGLEAELVALTKRVRPARRSVEASCGKST